MPKWKVQYREFGEPREATIDGLWTTLTATCVLFYKEGTEARKTALFNDVQSIVEASDPVIEAMEKDLAQRVAGAAGVLRFGNREISLANGFPDDLSQQIVEELGLDTPPNVHE